MKTYSIDTLHTPIKEEDRFAKAKSMSEPNLFVIDNSEDTLHTPIKEEDRFSKAKTMSAVDKYTKDQLSDVSSIVDEILSNIEGAYVQEIYAPKQTHAIYGLNQSNVNLIKEKLTKLGATKFRIIKNNYGFTTICFHLGKMIK